MNTLLFLLFAMMPQENPEFPYPEFSMKCLPETVMPGDTLYIWIAAKNPHTELIYISDYFLPTSQDIQIHIIDSDSQNQPLLFETPTTRVPSRDLRLVEMRPGATRIIGALSINIPALEDIRDPFWEKHMKTIPHEGKEFLLKTTISFQPSTDSAIPTHAMQEVILEQKVLLKSRPDNEMAMIKNWYKKTPKELFPMPEGGENPVRKIPSQRQFMLPESKNIQVQNEKYSQWYFIRLGNRYPSDPNAPETWQGWQKLEDSITPSTMRDEIRLTRILIQYCDTEEDKVLTELKDWFVGMNEVQRTAMAKNVCDLAWNSRGTKLFESFKKIYGAIKEYDIADKSDYMRESLEAVGLLEASERDAANIPVSAIQPESKITQEPETNGEQGGKTIPVATDDVDIISELDQYGDGVPFDN